MGMRWYLIVKAMESGCTFEEAADAVAEVLQDRLDTTLRTYSEWEEHLQKGTKK
jgi:hypothetical protein